MKELELYLHIPFCVKNAITVIFSPLRRRKRPDAAYVDTLIREIEGFEEPEDYEVVTVFFGGGTPSIPAGRGDSSADGSPPEKVSLPGRGRNHAGSQSRNCG
ncbi:MAG: hypothetical protein ACLR2E_10950 [Lachnospiraceae bacterium]